MTGAYPFLIVPGWFSTMTWALKFLHSLEASFPLRISLTDTFLTLKPTLSPGGQYGNP